MRRIAAFAVVALALVVTLGASADPNGGATRDHGQGKWYRHACDAPGGHRAACNAFVVTDSAGKPLASGAPPASALTPAQFHSGYALPTSGGGDQTVAIVDAYDDPTAESDLATFSSQFGLPACTSQSGCFRKVNENGGTSYPAVNGGWALEIALDVETVHGICPSCKILLVEASSNSDFDLYKAENEAVALGANVVSNSWGGGEYSGETSDSSTYFNHPGVMITVSSGDSGYGVEYPAASRYVTAVGGTSLHLSGGVWSSESAWSGAGSGCSAYESKPSWQHDSSCSRRTVADVSADADPNTGAAILDSTPYNGGTGWYQVGGTSLASPLVAAVYALTGTASSGTYASTPYANAGSLHDITSGGNGSCGGSYLCTALSGYDGPTGLGSPNGLAGFTAGSTQQPDFTIGTSQSSATVTQGTDAVYTVNVGSIGGFNGTVALSASGPAGATYTFTPASVTGSGSSTLAVHTGSVAPGGPYTVTISGTSGATHTTTVSLTVQAKPAGDFSISVSPSSARIARTGTSTYRVTITRLNGFTGTVSLSASGFPIGMTGSFSSIVNNVATFTVHASGLPRRRTYTLTITGTSGTLAHSATLTLST
ncbi:MAG TPA: hypothetical protein VFA82_02440 [Gaiellaceae bacterium]|nr:hypothetical protein [Gaiellaceae bacterium]